MLEIHGTVELIVETGKIKCERVIPLADCSCVATAKLAGAKVAFTKREKDLI